MDLKNAEPHLKGNKQIKGILHSVRPICHEYTKVFIQNSREYTIIETPKYGEIIQMEIGALLVGKITNYKPESNTVKIGREKGYFEYGGSTIILLFQNRFDISKELKDRIKIDGEIPVSIGDKII